MNLKRSGLWAAVWNGGIYAKPLDEVVLKNARLAIQGKKSADVVIGTFGKMEIAQAFCILVRKAEKALRSQDNEGAGIA